MKNKVTLLDKPKSNTKIVCINDSVKKQNIELFDKNNGINFHGYGNECWKSVSVEVITSDRFNKFKQTYADFFQSILETGILINNIKTTNNKKVDFFIKDLIQGGLHFPKMEGQYFLKGRSIMHVTLLPKKKFIIEFDIIGKEISRVEMESTS